MADLASKIKEAIHDWLNQTLHERFEDGECEHLPSQYGPPDCERLTAILMELVDDEHPAGEPCFRCGHPSLADHDAGGCISCGCSSPFGGLT